MPQNRFTEPGTSVLPNQYRVFGTSVGCCIANEVLFSPHFVASLCGVNTRTSLQLTNSLIENQIFIVDTFISATDCSLLSNSTPQPSTLQGVDFSRRRFLGRGCDDAIFRKGFFSEKGGGNSVNEGFGKDFSRKGNSVKRSRPVSEPPDFENSKLAVLIPFPK